MYSINEYFILLGNNYIIILFIIIIKIIKLYIIIIADFEHEFFNLLKRILM